MTVFSLFYQNRRLCHIGLATVAAGVMVLTPPLLRQAHAQTAVYSRTDPQAGFNNYIDWAQIGPDGTQVPNGFSAVSNSNAVHATVTNSNNGDMERFTQKLNAAWAGNFAQGDAVLWNLGNGPMTFTFDTGVSAAGLQLNSGYYGSYDALLMAYDQNGNFLGQATSSGVMNNDNDNSAAFLGIRNTSANIFKLTYSLTSAPGGTTSNFAVNRLSVTQDLSGASVTPEAPALLNLTAALLAPGLGCVAVRRRRKRAAAVSAV